MLNLKLLVLVLVPIVSCGIHKTFKPANFETDVPKFTPFENEEVYNSNKGRQLKTTESSTSPSPSAETLVNKISSRIKMPEKYVADLNKSKDVRKVAKDFGSFNFENAEKELENEVEPKNDERIDSEAEKVEEVDVIDEAIEVTENTNSTLFKVGQVFNLTVDSADDSVKVNLDHQALKEIFTGRGSGGKKGYEKYIVLFILPFIIQSAILPFMVAKIKILLLKSLFAGKLALLLFLLGALKSHTGYGISKSYTQSTPFLFNPSPFLPDKRIEHNAPELNEYEKKAEPFIRNLHS